MLEMFKRISQVSQYTASSQEIGKIINMLSQDLNEIEDKLIYLFIALEAPFYMAAAFTLFIVRLGWPGVLCPLIILIVVPIQVAIAKMNSNILRGLNAKKDRRIKLTTQAIEGIYFIKLYGW